MGFWVCGGVVVDGCVLCVCVGVVVFVSCCDEWMDEVVCGREGF